MEKQKKENRKITANEKDMKKLSGRLLKLFKDHDEKYDVENDCHAISRLVTDMEKKGLVLSNAYKTIRSHVFNDVSDLDINWLHNYCDYFQCSADYILGYIDQPTHIATDINTKSGLSNKAINSLLDDKETQLVVNSLLETHSIDFFTQALYLTRHCTDMNSTIVRDSKKKKIPGVTSEDLDHFEKTIKRGNKAFNEKCAIDCFSALLTDKNIDDYFFDKDFELYSKNLNSEI